MLNWHLISTAISLDSIPTHPVKGWKTLQHVAEKVSTNSLIYLISFFHFFAEIDTTSSVLMSIPHT